MRFSVLQWNVWFKEDPDRIISFLKEQEADIVCLQELTCDYDKHGDMPALIAAQAGYPYYEAHYLPDAPGARKLWSQANGIFSKYPLTLIKKALLSGPDFDGFRNSEYRGYLECQVQVAGQAFTIATAHTSFTHGFTRSPYKDEETDRLLEFAARAPGSYILAGDFNDLPGSTTVNKLESVLTNAGPPYDHNSWTTKRFEYPDFIADGLNWRMDYIFTGSEMAVIESQTLPTDVSDHLPILATFLI